jgi:lipopolysaccharide cholinephosphotransferase
MNNFLKRTSFLHTWITISLTAFFFCLPISKSGEEISLIMAITPLIILPEYRKRIGEVLREPWCKLLIIFCLFFIISCLWSPATTQEKIIVLRKYMKFLYLPVLVVAFRVTQAQKLALNAFISAMLIICIISIAKHHEYLLSFFLDPDPGTIFLNHIITGIMMAMAAYLAAYFFIQEESRRRYVWMVLWFLFSYQIFFVNTGRTGYIIYICLSAIFMIQFYSWKQLIIGVLCSSTLLSVIFFNSPIMRAGLLELTQSVQNYQHQKDTSLGFRLQFHQYARSIYNEHRIFGIGSAGLSHDFKEKKPIPSFLTSLFHPHNQYWLILAEQGLLGFIAYIAFLGMSFKHSIQSPSIRPISYAIYTIISVVSLSASIFFYGSPAFFYISMMALCLSESDKQIPANQLTLDCVMKDGRLKQAQIKMFNMLKLIDSICKKHHLDYWLDAGTLLGAVRHQGFIPWDDDMDIAMPRDSYEKFLRIAPTELPAHLWLQRSETETGYYNLGAPLKIRDRSSYYLEKHEIGNEPYVQGIFVDIFVYDKMPVNKTKRRLYKTYAKKLLRILSTKYTPLPMGHYHNLYKTLGVLLPKSLLNNALNRLIKKANAVDSPYWGRGYHCKKSTILKMDEVYPLKQVPFESGYFNIPQHAETILTREYGDFMTLPPEHERVLRHCRALVPERPISVEPQPVVTA